MQPPGRRTSAQHPTPDQTHRPSRHHMTQPRAQRPPASSSASASTTPASWSLYLSTPLWRSTAAVSAPVAAQEGGGGGGVFGTRGHARGRARGPPARRGGPPPPRPGGRRGGGGGGGGGAGHFCSARLTPLPHPPPPPRTQPSGPKQACQTPRPTTSRPSPHTGAHTRVARQFVQVSKGKAAVLRREAPRQRRRQQLRAAVEGHGAAILQRAGVCGQQPAAGDRRGQAQGRSSRQQRVRRELLATSTGAAAARIYTTLPRPPPPCDAGRQAGSSPPAKVGTCPTSSSTSPAADGCLLQRGGGGGACRNHEQPRVLRVGAQGTGWEAGEPGGGARGGVGAGVTGHEGCMVVQGAGQRLDWGMQAPRPAGWQRGSALTPAPWLRPGAAG